MSPTPGLARAASLGVGTQRFSPPLHLTVFGSVLGM